MKKAGPWAGGNPQGAEVAAQPPPNPLSSKTLAVSRPQKIHADVEELLLRQLLPGQRELQHRDGRRVLGEDELRAIAGLQRVVIPRMANKRVTLAAALQYRAYVEAELRILARAADL